MKKTVEFFLYPQVVALDVSGPLEVFSAANKILLSQNHADKGYSFIFSGFEAGPIETGSSLSMVANALITDEHHRDILIIPGSMNTEDIASCPTSIEILTKAASFCHRLVSVCNGAMILAACGLLNQKNATTHWMLTDELSARYPEVNVDHSSIYVQDGNTYTSAGVTAGIDLALALVEEDFGGDLAMEVAQYLVLYRRRPGSQKQFSKALQLQTIVGKRFLELHNWLQQNIQLQHTVDCMAKKVGMSPRNFARVFKTETGLGPGRYLEAMRLNIAREQLEAGEKNLATIAFATGFLREERLRRSFIRRLGITPVQYRNHFHK